MYWGEVGMVCTHIYKNNKKLKCIGNSEMHPWIILFESEKQPDQNDVMN